jgi:hypothetical protein
MFGTVNTKSAKTLLYSFAVVGLAGFGLFYTASFNDPTAEAQSSPVEESAVSVPAATFAADGGSLGSIPDGTSLTPCSSVTPKNVTFTVAGLSGAPSNVEVSMTSSGPVHTFVGDLVATLIAPNGSSHVVFGRTGATSAGSFGSGSDFSGPYNFKDSAAGTNWWTAAATTPVPAGDYKSTLPGPTTTPAGTTLITPDFAGVANPNGTWTLRFQDCASGDTGNISAATLTLTASATPTQHYLDFNGDGKTDFTVIRNTGGGPSGQLTWFINYAGTGTTTGAAWGIATDFRIAGDYDGDGKTDLTVWRPGAAGVASYYILNSATLTARVEAFGQSGDDPTVVGDYNGDGKADLAVYRAGANSGDPSTWFYRTVASGPVAFVPWGVNGDFPAPGDYDGDGKADFVIQRNNGGGQARFWMSLTTAGFNTVVFGTPTDVIVPGDYDGDGKTDIATVRGSAGQVVWFVRPSSTGVISAAPYATFGASATDFVAQGDYDGDGKTDVAIWRPSATPGASVFWVLGSTAGAFGVPFGQNGDAPLANYNAH